jgi:hypothetical protein
VKLEEGRHSFLNAALLILSKFVKQYPGYFSITLSWTFVKAVEHGSFFAGRKAKLLTAVGIETTVDRTTTTLLINFLWTLGSIVTF